MKEYEIKVVQTKRIKVLVTEEFFSEEFMEEFREYMYPFTTVEEHIKHLSQLKARDMIEPDGFVEGYGELKGDVILSELDSEMEIEVLKP